MNTMNLTSKQIIAASLLALTDIISAPGCILYTGRAIRRWPIRKTPVYLHWKRGFISTAVLALVPGLALRLRG